MKKFFVLLVSLLCVLVITPGLNPSGLSVHAAQGSLSADISIVGEGATKIASAGSLSVYSIKWENLTKFSPSVGGIDEEELDGFKWFVHYSKSQYAVGLSMPPRQLMIDHEGHDIGLSFDYDINHYGGTIGTSSFPLGFGVYQFRFNYRLETDPVNEYPHWLNTDYVEVIPSVITEKPQIEYSTIPSSQTMLNSFAFKIVNDNYKYCDDRQIKWYASASVQGTEWVIEDSSVEMKIVGREFLFLPDIRNTFYVWCVVTTETETFESDPLNVSTLEESVDLTTFWIIVGSSAGALFIIFIVAALITSKREKIW